MSDTLPFAGIFGELSGPGGLAPNSVRLVFDAIFSGAWTSAQIGGFLVALRLQGDSAEVIRAAAEAMRAVMIPVEHDFETLLDTCGTGGDGSHTLNLSTGAAIIAAAAGVPVAKHGNRAATSKSGSADVLEALGIPLDVPCAAQVDVLRDARIAFLFAGAHHPAMRHAMPIRRELGIRTLFNCLGPLANPARVSHQLLGAYDDAIRPILAEALRGLGTRRAWVVRSSDGMDEVSPCARTRVTELSGGKLSEFEIAPEDFGIAPLSAADIRGAEPASNAAALLAVLAGEPHPARDAFVLNAAAALCVALELQPKQAADRAREALESGAAQRTLETWRKSALARRVPAR
ncbi:MAG TPA: anthranilate phosphoribosyltransferase [Polyangiaceae bacterium]|jgi:anthranilate phosphoribosyltransferase|nr:anthranilate phosphoribosyltransferase [Polyangiaceae bacterium]